MIVTIVTIMQSLFIPKQSVEADPGEANPQSPEPSDLKPTTMREKARRDLRRRRLNSIETGSQSTRHKGRETPDEVEHRDESYKPASRCDGMDERWKDERWCWRR